MAQVFELSVGIMLVILGANVLRNLVPRGTSHTHEHAAIAPRSAGGWRVSRPLLVGMVHGLAGSAPLLLLTLTVMSSPFGALSYIAVFGVGSVMGMTVMSLLVSVPARLTGQFTRTNLALRGLSGLFSVGLGLFIVYENGVLNRLS
jgi:high-affinity nickel-transport protein